MQASFEDVHALFLIFGWLCWASISDQVPGQGCNIRSVWYLWSLVGFHRHEIHVSCLESYIDLLVMSHHPSLFNPPSPPDNRVCRSKITAYAPPKHSTPIPAYPSSASRPPSDGPARRATPLYAGTAPPPSAQPASQCSGLAETLRLPTPSLYRVSVGRCGLGLFCGVPSGGPRWSRWSSSGYAA